jgi:hypothetical protein
MCSMKNCRDHLGAAFLYIAVSPFLAISKVTHPKECKSVTERPQVIVLWRNDKVAGPIDSVLAILIAANGNPLMLQQHFNQRLQSSREKTILSDSR